MLALFPAIGHRYVVDFSAFDVELYFRPDVSFIYTNLDQDGNPVGSETAEIKVEPIRDQLLLVTWQELNKTPVVHLEDYRENTTITNITDPDLIFSEYHGTMKPSL